VARQGFRRRRRRPEEEERREGEVNDVGKMFTINLYTTCIAIQDVLLLPWSGYEQTRVSEDELYKRLEGCMKT
jgi:hypothetical protein